MTIPPQVEQVITKIDAFMAKYPQVSQYGEFSNDMRSIATAPVGRPRLNHTDR